MQTVRNNAIVKKNAIYLRSKGFTYSKISEKLKISLNTVKSLCYRRFSESKYCKQCGKRLLQNSKVKPKSFCTDKCRKAFWYVRHEITQLVEAVK
jgi:orotate phosphoribosyltransferase-like protein